MSNAADAGLDDKAEGLGDSVALLSSAADVVLEIHAEVLGESKSDAGDSIRIFFLGENRSESDVCFFAIFIGGTL